MGKLKQQLAEHISAVCLDDRSDYKRVWCFCQSFFTRRMPGNADKI